MPPRMKLTLTFSIWICLLTMQHTLLAQDFDTLDKDGVDSLYAQVVLPISDQPDSAVLLFGEFIGRINDPSQRLIYYEKFLVALNNMSLYEKARPVINEALELPHQPEDMLVYGQILNLQIDDFRRLGQLDSAIAVSQKYYDLALEAESLPDQSAALLEIGLVYEGGGDYLRALDFLLRAVAVAEQSKDSLAMASTYTNIAINYKNLQEKEKAIEYDKKALKIFQRMGVGSQIVQAANNLGLTYDKLDQFDSARFYLELGLKKARESEHRFGIAITTLNLGLNAYRRKDYSRAIELFDEVLGYFKAIRDPYGETLCYYNYSRIYWDIGNVDKAIEYGAMGFDLANKSGFVNLIADNAEYLSLAYENVRNYKLALEYYKHYRTIEDSLVDKEKSREIGRLESRFDLEQARLQNEVLKKDQEIQQQQLELSTYLVIGVSIVLIAVVVFLLTLRRTNLRLVKSRATVQDQARKLAELDAYKSRFFANISHDLRTPISLIHGYLNDLADDDESFYTRKAENTIRKGLKNVDRLVQMTEEIRDLILLEEGNLKLEYKKVQIAPYLSLLVELFRSHAESKGLSLTFNSKVQDNFEVAVDPNSFEKIIYNLVSNALKFTEEGSVGIDVYGDDDTFTMNVADTGKGIPEPQARRVFERFYQSPDDDYLVQQGMGIGLFLVQEMVNLHNGSIVLKSDVGKGSVFTMVLPRNIELATSTYQPTGSEESKRKTNMSMDQEDIPIPMEPLLPDHRTILVVDDHPEVRDYIGSQLKGDYNLLYAANGVQALDTLNKMQVDLLITDLMMPLMDGFELLENTREKYPTLPVLVVSARTSVEDTSEILGYGINDFISKPFDRSHFQMRVKNILDQKSRADNLPIFEKDHIKLANNKALTKVNELVDQHMSSTKIGIAELADVLCLSERQTNRVIKSITGKSPGEYVKNYKLQYAQSLLQSKEITSASELAKMVGFSNVTHFNDAFEKKFGYRPMQAAK